MTKLRKQRRKKVYRHNVNRKRLRNKLCRTGKIQCKDIEEAWNNGKSIRKNLLEMGLSYDPNETIKLPKTKDKLKASVLSNENGEWNVDKIVEQQKPTKLFVVNKLETEAKAPRLKLFRLPKGQVEWITYFIDKYGNDYKAMVKDDKNYNQHTWKQFRAKIKRFKTIPEQYNVYLKQRGLENSNIDKEYDDDSD